MNDLTPSDDRSPIVDLDTLRKRYAAMTPADRAAEADKLSTQTAIGLLKQGALYYQMKLAGDDMEPVKRRLGGLLELLLRIGGGTVLPEVYLRFGAKSRLFPAIARLDPIDQARLGKGERVEMLVPGTDGKQTLLPVDPLALDDAQIKQVFARDHIRTQAEQLAYLSGVRQKAAQPLPEQVGRLILDKELKVAKYGKAVFSLAELKAAVAILSR
jgi:hypothetical protein